MAKGKCTAGELIGANARVVLKPLTDEEMYVKGLNSYKLPGMTREEITVDDFERDFAGTLAGGGAYTGISFAGNLISGDPTQDEIQIRMTQNAEFDDMFIFTHKRRGDFWAMDLARDPCGKIMFTSFDYNEAGKSDTVQVTVAASVDGPSGIFNIHTPELMYAISNGELTATDGDFINRGFKEGMSIIIETGDTSNPYMYGLVSDITATTIILEDATISMASGTGKIHGMSKVVPKQ